LGFPYRGALAPAEASGRVTRDGYHFEPRDGSADREVLSPFHEVQTRSLVRKYIASGSGGVFVDVGAHSGSFSIPYESFFDRVLAIEPLPDNYRAMQRNIALNNLEGKIRSFNLAAGATNTHGTLFVKGDETSSLVPMESPSGTLGVTVRSLDDLLIDEGISASEVRLIKADVEGGELEVLAGAQRLLAEGSPMVVLEANTESAKRSLVRFMDRIGYVLVREADGRNLCFRRHHEQSLPPALALVLRGGSKALNRVTNGFARHR
jgi:FkbM family methyltransferase